MTTTSSIQPATSTARFAISDTVTAELNGRRAQAQAIAAAVGQITAPIANALRSLVRLWNEQGDVSRAYSQLKRFDDRMLADIGLDRDNLLASLQQYRAQPSDIAATPAPRVGSVEAVRTIKPANADSPNSAASSRAA
jgi:uncharacterized protein YjiS (DUF1127 family)